MGHRVEHGRAEDFLASLPDDSAGLILTDPPYFRVKGEAWDRAWSNEDRFLAWLGDIADEWRRVLKPNGTLVCFAANNPAKTKGATMAARVECMLGERFNVIGSVTWAKPTGRHNGHDRTRLRAPAPATERAIIGEQYGAEGWALGESAYVRECDKLRGFVFEPLRAYLAGEWERAGLTTRDANKATGTQMAGHWFTSSQWALPTRKHYETLRARANRGEPGEHLRREYEDLRREYEDLRRPFDAPAGTHFTDVWEYPVVMKRGKHVCEKPEAMALDIVRQCSRPGDVVLDAFAGSGVFLWAAASLGRAAWGCDFNEEWAAHSASRVANATRCADVVPITRKPAPKPRRVAQLPLFAACVSR